MERVLAPENLHAAYRRVRANKGAPGVDGMTVNELAAYLRANWLAIREQLLTGEYNPAAVRRHGLPKPGGGERVLGIPTVLDRFKERIRALTQRTRGRSLRQIVVELRVYLRGWQEYFGLATGRSRIRELGAWIQRRLRNYQWKQWGARGYRELRRRGVSRKLAWNTSKSAHGAWRISMSPALSIALPTQYFVSLGLPLLRGVR